MRHTKTQQTNTGEISDMLEMKFEHTIKEKNSVLHKDIIVEKQ